MFKEKVKRKLIAVISNPLIIIIYFLFLYNLASVCKYGRMGSNIIILCISFVSILVSNLIVIFRKDNFKIHEWIGNSKIWRYISIIMILGITILYGSQIYNSATNGRDRLYQILNRIDFKEVEFIHNNIYKDGVQGILQDIDSRFDLPNKLYIANSFTLGFNKEGKITNFDTYIYGKGFFGNTKTYLITYDENKSKNIEIRLDGFAEDDYNDDKLLEPLIKTVKVAPIKEAVQNLNSQKLGLVYYGKRNWGYNIAGMVDIYEDGTCKNVNKAGKPIIGYTVSIYVPEEEITPIRYNLKCNESWSKSKTPPKKEIEKANEYNSKQNYKDEFYLSKYVGYKLKIEAATAGNRSYSLNKTTDGGKSWNLINEDPTNGLVGWALGIKFINKNVGFIGLSFNNESNAEIFRTDDGGITFKEVKYEKHKVKLKHGGYITPFDVPRMPYEEDGKLNMIVRQGSDGDYNGNISALYQSEDEGKTWKYIKEIKKS